MKIIGGKFVIGGERKVRIMTKKERIRLLIGIAVMAVIFSAVAAIGWTDDEFIVTYDYGFDGKYESVDIKKGRIKEPVTAVRHGYVFEGWYYTDKQGNEILFDFESERVTTNLELTAHWSPYETDLYLDANGGKCEVDEMLLIYDAEYSIPTPQRKGYYFAGWMYGEHSRIIFNETSGIWNDPVLELNLTACWSKFRPGTSYFIGEYEQTAIYEDEKFVGWEKKPIEWIPVEKKDGKYLLVTRYVIDYMPLGTENSYVHWSQTDLRRWLNNEFYNKAFTDAEKAFICDFTDDELGTTDKVFLLSVDETNLLYGDGLYIFGTEYANSKGFDLDPSWEETLVNGEMTMFHPWLTRTWKNDSNWALMGSHIGYRSPRQLSGIRPAIWVDAEKLLSK